MFDSTKLWYLKRGHENDPNTQLRSPVVRFHPYRQKFYLNLYPYGFVAAIGTWVSVSLFVSPGDYDDIWLWPFQRSSNSESEINWTPSVPLARHLSPRNSLDQLQPTSLVYQQFDVLTSSHIRNSRTKVMAISLMTLCVLKFIFLAPQYLHLTSLFSFFYLSHRGPNHFQYLNNAKGCY